MNEASMSMTSTILKPNLMEPILELKEHCEKLFKKQPLEITLV